MRNRIQSAAVERRLSDPLNGALIQHWWPAMKGHSAGENWGEGGKGKPLHNSCTLLTKVSNQGKGQLEAAAARRKGKG